MATAITTKIVLKNTTKITLNERFTALRSQANANAYRQKIQMQRQASSANLRLAQQMANRPSVIAALRLKKRSLLNRLGQRGQQSTNSSIKSRLNLGGMRIKGRVGGAFIGKGKNMPRRGGFISGTSPLLKGRLGIPKSGFNSNPSNKRIGFRRGGFRGNRQPRGGFRGNRQSRGGNRQQVQRSNSRISRGRGRWWNNSKVTSVPTKQELDNQLDEYMAETKSSLDAQLGHYMSQA